MALALLPGASLNDEVHVTRLRDGATGSAKLTAETVRLEIAVAF